MSLGYPDYGLVTQTEMVANASVIARTVDVPVIADADTGYGNELNVTRTVREYERAGIAAIHIEDQASPKRCGHLDGKELIPLNEYVAKIRAAAAARHDPNFVIIARTDANAVTGFEDTINRANTALANGADIAFVEAPKTIDEVTAIPKRVKGPCLLNVVTGGITPDLNMADARDMGYRIAILPSQTLRQEVQRHSLITIPFCQTANNDSFVRPLSIVHRRKRRLNPAIMEFIELLRAGDKTIQSDQDRAVQVEANHDREIAALAPSQEESTETAL